MKPELNSEPQDIEIEQVFIHPEYVRTQVYNDIALIKLIRKVTLSAYIRPACLWNKFEITQTKTIATGWGATENGNFYIKLLMWCVYCEGCALTE